MFKKFIIESIIFLVKKNNTLKSTLGISSFDEFECTLSNLSNKELDNIYEGLEEMLND